MAPTELVRALYEAYQARNWVEAGQLLHRDVCVALPATRERLIGHEQTIEFQRRYPEPWGDMAVLRVFAGVNVHSVEAAAEIEVVEPDRLTRLAAFWTCRDGLLWRGVEYWVTVGGETPPTGRAAYPALG